MRTVRSVLWKSIVLLLTISCLWWTYLDKFIIPTLMGEVEIHGVLYITAVLLLVVFFGLTMMLGLTLKSMVYHRNWISLNDGVIVDYSSFTRWKRVIPLEKLLLVDPLELPDAEINFPQEVGQKEPLYLRLEDEKNPYFLRQLLIHDEHFSRLITRRKDLVDFLDEVIVERKRMTA
ncbi:hypothetical protein [Sanyastnella coralliicola]|uniref:hypothetical protein n=1 Tax=Sanyastnella coralliicola TaxID=3069118 RepID=UPI0027B977B1|nr:hypothetical protein [Longitalea sp. SCSIO 12813]